MGDPTVIAGILGVVSIGISGLAGWATHKSAMRASERNTTVTSRTDIEREAFARAQGFYTDTIDRQQKEIADLEDDVRTLKGKVAHLETELATAQAALRIRYPDE